MRILTLGAGPAGLYFSLLMKKADPRHEILVIERNPPDATYGWGVVFSEETLGALRDADRTTFDQLTDAFASWNAIDIRYRGETIRSRGHVFSAVARKELLGILQRRCRELGVELRFMEDVADLFALPEADLVVGADGVNSLVRRTHAEEFGPTLDVHPTKFAWFGTDLVFTAFTFIFRENAHGLFQMHGYPFDAATSTFIVECPEETWRRAGLDRMDEAESIAYCEKLFAEDLRGHSLLSNRSLWVSFVTVRNQTWHRGNVVLLGDAAHTAHFTIGSGTKLAMEDAVALAEALARRPDLEGALTDYELERQPVVERFQQAAMESASYFENVRRYSGFEPIQFAFHLLTRSGRITHLSLRMRDPSFVDAVDGWFAGMDGLSNGAGLRIAPPPMFAALRCRGVTASNRVVVVPSDQDDAVEGVPGPAIAARLAEAARTGAGVVGTGFVAISRDGRITPGSAGMYGQEHLSAWRGIVVGMRAAGPARPMIHLGHAGRRGATRPRAEGVDLPLREGGWPLLSASEIPYAPWSPTPKAMDRADMDAVVADFVAAADSAGRAGFDVLELNMADGYLLASFLSPLANRRADRYGGPLRDRARFPLEVFDAVRSAWPEERPLGVVLTATDWAPGGLHLEEAVAVARWLKERGCDLVNVRAGQTTPWTRPVYGRFFLVPMSDRVRNEAGIPTMVGGGLTTYDEIDTIVAAGRADLCLLDRALA